MNLSRRDCENAEIFWWKLYNNYYMYKRTRQECLNPEKYLPADVIKKPFMRKFLGTCKSRLNSGEALLKIEQLKDAADKALPNVLEKCNCKKKDYRITNKLKARLIELAGLFYLKSYKLISEKDFIKLYTSYSNRYYNSQGSKKRYSKKDVQKASSRILNTVFVKNLEKGISNVTKPVNVETSTSNVKRTSARNTRKTTARNVRRTSARNVRRTSARNIRRTSGRSVKRTSARNVRRTSSRNVRRTSARNVRKTSGRNVRKTKK
tara:strand:+ start:8428 stop:9219 length:792 start_codon:yes stop_codon:yes gene_type:complete